MEKRVLEYYDFEEAVNFIATKYRLNEYEINQELVALFELGSMLVFTMYEDEYYKSSEYVSLFIKEFGADAKYIWEW